MTENISDELVSLLHLLNDVYTVQKTTKIFMEKALEINKNNEARIKKYGERLDRLVVEQPKEDHHKPAPGAYM